MSERELGPIGTALLFENDRVRIWEVRLAPGGARRGAPPRPRPRAGADPRRPRRGGVRAGLARHRGAPYFEAPIAPGQFSFMRRGGIETAVNVGTEDYHEIIVELKD